MFEFGQLSVSVFTFVKNEIELDDYKIYFNTKIL